MSDDPDERIKRRMFDIACAMEDRKNNPSRSEVEELLWCACRTLWSIDAGLTQAHKRSELVAVRVALERYLLGSANSLDHAFRLIRSARGNPTVADEERDIGIAGTILQYRLAGKSYRRAIEEAMREWSCRKTTAQKAWRNRKFTALLREVKKRSEGRSKESWLWSDEEESALLQAYKMDERILDWTGVRRNSRIGRT